MRLFAFLEALSSPTVITRVAQLPQQFRLECWVGSLEFMDNDCLPFLYQLFTLSVHQVNPRVTLWLPILYLLVT